MKNREIADLFGRWPKFLGSKERTRSRSWMMSLGVAVAKRGWIEPPDLLNTMHLKDLLKWCRRTN